jgi:magnesium-transporting ATPase (P-type)
MLLIHGFDSVKDRKMLINVKETQRETTLCLAAAHALVLLDDGTVVGDPMEKTTLEVLDWKLSKGVFFRFSEMISETKSVCCRRLNRTA